MLGANHKEINCQVQAAANKLLCSIFGNARTDLLAKGQPYLVSIPVFLSGDVSEKTPLVDPQIIVVSFECAFEFFISNSA